MRAPIELSKAARHDLAALPKQDARSVRMVRQRYVKALEVESPEVVIRFVRLLLRGAGWAERVVAWETLATHTRAFARIDDQLAEHMAEGLSDWGSVDLYGVTVLGPAWREGRATDSLILSWTRSPDRWRRRLALVATVPLNSRARGGRGDARRTLAVCRPLIADRDDMVVKAMSWALRELSKKDPTDVRRFLRQESDRIASRVRREVRNKLETNLKTPRRAKKAKKRKVIKDIA